MQESTIYECAICKNKSKIKSLIENCESLGLQKSGYDVGDYIFVAIEFPLAPFEHSYSGSPQHFTLAKVIGWQHIGHEVVYKVEQELPSIPMIPSRHLDFSGMQKRFLFEELKKQKLVHSDCILNFGQFFQIRPAEYVKFAISEEIAKFYFPSIGLFDKLPSFDYVNGKWTIQYYAALNRINKRISS